MSDTLKELAERVERGETGREIEAKVFRAFGYRVLFRDAEALQESRFSAFPTDDDSDRIPPKLLCVSTSLDAVAALAERVLDHHQFTCGYRWPNIHGEGECFYASIELAFGKGDFSAEAPTECGARLAAILRAKAAP